MKIKSIILIIIFINCIQLLAQDSIFVLIPSGEYFITEYEYDEEINDNKRVYKKVSINKLLIHKYEVTNEQYKKFIIATNHRKPKYWNNERFNKPQQPVVGISFEDATKYCEWANLRLPTDIEWEIAARGGLQYKRFPNGDTLKTTEAIFYPDDEVDYKDYFDNTGEPKEVGNTLSNNYGIFDMAGNVFEWTSNRFILEECRFDILSEFEWIRNNSVARYIFYDLVTYAHNRGGSWKSSDFELEIGYIIGTPVSSQRNDVGFRCVKEVK